MASLDGGLPTARRHSSSAHEPQNGWLDLQRLVHFEVHGRNARKKSGVVSFWRWGRAKNRLKPELQAGEG
jgi:hypothetical protein